MLNPLEKELFDLVDDQAQDESQLPGCHIVFPIDNYYRIYHAMGYCLMVERMDSLEDNETYAYTWGGTYKGFIPITTIEEAVALVKQWFSK